MLRMNRFLSLYLKYLSNQYSGIQEELYGDVDEEDFSEEEAPEKDPEDIHYEDFFKGKNEEDVEDQEEANELDEEIENAVFEEVREGELANQDGKTKIDEEIDRLEDKILGQKPWQLKGEVRGLQRPKNSLLEEDLDFKSGVKMIENTVSKEFSEGLEKVIQQRVLDEAWDDVPEYIFSSKIQENFANEEQLNFQKSQKGLGEIYEDKFKKNILNLPVETEGDKTKVEIQELFKNLCFKLDQLSNLSFVPRPESLQQAKISVSNIASIKREEKIPIFMSEGMQKGTNELFDQKKGVFEEKAEMTKEEKKQKHRKVKRNLRNRNKEKRKKEKMNELTVMGQTKFQYNQIKKSQAKIKKETQQKGTESVKYTKSTQFFQNLQVSY